MSQPYVAGPVPIFVGVGSGFSPLFLGMAERGVYISLDHEYTPYVVDIAGNVPLDFSYQGTNAIIQFTLTSWRENTLALMDDVARLGAASVRGRDDFGDIGTLVGFERVAYTTWLPFPYQTKLAFRNNVFGAMPAGYRFPLTFLERSSLPDRGPRPSKVDIVLRAVRQYSSGGSSAANKLNLASSALTLYDHNMTAVSGLIF